MRIASGPPSSTAPHQPRARRPGAGRHDNGEGLVGETDDRIITFFSLGVVVFFFLVVCLGSFIQGRLEKRKDARKAAELRQRIGW